MRTAGRRRRRAGEAQGPRAVFRPGPCARLCGWMRRTTPDAKAVAEWRRDVPRQRASCNRGLHRPPRGTDRCEKPRTAKRPPPKAIFRLSRRADATRGALFAREYRWADAARRFGHGNQIGERNLRIWCGRDLVVALLSGNSFVHYENIFRTNSRCAQKKKKETAIVSSLSSRMALGGALRITRPTIPSARW